MIMSCGVFLVVEQVVSHATTKQKLSENGKTGGMEIAEGLNYICKNAS
jgi:hypothetical protein